MQKPYSQACENNKEAIRQVLENYISEPSTLLEVGSGTGQHAVYLSSQFSTLTWYTSDREENMAGIAAWVDDYLGDNLRSPMILDVNSAVWEDEQVDFVFSANTVHIMSWGEVEKLFSFIPECLKAGGCFMLYGPFNYDGKYTSESNANFDLWLKAQAPHRAIRDFEALDELASRQGLSLIADHSMPANNKMLVWQLNAIDL